MSTVSIIELQTELGLSRADAEYLFMRLQQEGFYNTPLKQIPMKNLTRLLREDRTTQQEYKTC